MHWLWSSFSALSPQQLYDVLSLRQKVFVIEQDCIYQDCDGMDADSKHLMGYKDGKLVAYLRFLPAGLKYSESSIGRVVTDPSVRAQGIGQNLMNEALRWFDREHASATIRISAQHYLLNFYRRFGFEPKGEVYLEDGIPHQEMLRLGPRPPGS